MIISGLTVPEIKEVLVLVREIEQRHPEDLIFINLEGSEDKPVEEMLKVLKEVFPKRGDEEPVFYTYDRMEEGR